MRSPLACLFLATVVSAQGDWAFVSPGVNPPKTSSACAFDSTRGVTVCVIADITVTQVWERAGHDWTVRASTGGAVRRNDSIAYDSRRGVTVVVCGGSGLDDGAGGTVAWNGSVLLPGSTSPGPTYRTRHAAAFDAVRGVTVLFGGCHTNAGQWGFFQDTWTYDGTTWTLRAPLTFPSLRAGHAMAFDANRGRVVMFGGTTMLARESSQQPPAVVHGDTWEWDGTNWFQRIPSGPTPPPRHEHAMAHDPTSGITYLFGGLDSAGQPLGDLWAFDGTSWTRIVTPNAPAQRFDCGMVFDTVRNKLVVYGGYQVGWGLYRDQVHATPGFRDTWEYTRGQPGAFQTYGAGCIGTRGVPGLRLQGNTPTAGTTLRVQIDQLPLVGPAFVFVGNSNTAYGSLSLPFALDAIGMTGCSLLASGDMLVPVQNILGTALLSVEVPRGLNGVSVYLQSIVADPGANPLGLTTSHGAHVRFGG